METREELKKKIALCDKLGARKFQKVVLKAEELKFRVLKDIFPSLPNRYETYLKRKRDRALKKATSEEDRDRIVDEYQKLLLEWKKEIKREKNRNYHMDENTPTEIVQYLEWNKRVHKRGLIIDAAIITGATILLGIEPMLVEALMESAPEISTIISNYTPIAAGTLISLEAVGAFLNFQCINIQNSHLYRYKIMEERIKKKEEKRNAELINKYGALAPVYQRCRESSIELPTVEDLISHCQTQEEIQQLRQMIQERIITNNRGKKNTAQPDKQVIVDTKQMNTESVDRTVERHFTTEVEERVNKELEKMINDKETPEKVTGVQKSIGGKK